VECLSNYEFKFDAIERSRSDCKKNEDLIILIK